MHSKEIQKLIDQLKKFRDERDWQQFHNPKDLALALSIEAGELNELFLWKKENELETVNPKRVAEELADVFSFALLLADQYHLDVVEIVEKKIERNARKYPVAKSKGLADKYDQLERRDTKLTDDQKNYHKWIESDDIVALYLYKFGDDLLPLNQEEISKHLGIKPSSMIMRMGNFKAMDGKGGLSSFSKQMRRVYEKYEGLDKKELRKMVLEILEEES